MKKKIMSLLLTLVGGIAINASASEILSIPYYAGFADQINYTCFFNGQGAIITSSSTGQCNIDVPIPLASGHTIKQITAFYGTDGAGPTSFTAALKYKDLRTFSSVGSVDVDTFHLWSTTTNVAASAVASANLMAQVGYPLTTYPDAFVIDGNKAYYVSVVLGMFSQTEFYGLKVLYD